MADRGPAATSTKTVDERRISVRDVQVNGNRDVLPSGHQVVASYNWSTTSTSGKPHIIAPGTARVYVSPSSKKGDPSVIAAGAPRLYVPPRGRGFTLDKDVGVQVVDENASMMHPFSSMEPLFHSLENCAPGFDMGAVDIVTDRNNLRKLLRFCDSPRSSTTTYIRPGDYRNEPFKFFVHGIGLGRKDGPTLVFTRATTGDEESSHGYGKSFEQKLTEEDPTAPSDTGRFSIISKMCLDGVTLLVRAKVDARETHPTKSSASASTGNVADAITEKLETLRVSPGRTNEDLPKRSGLGNTKAGELLGDEPQLLELKTKTERFTYQINWKDFYWQMVLGCAHKLVLGLHTRGKYLPDGMHQLPIQKVKARAEEAGSSSMVYLANTLREVIKAAHCLMAAHGATAFGKSVKGNDIAVVVEHSPCTRRGNGTLRVRLAVASNGAVAPSLRPNRFLFYIDEFVLQNRRRAPTCTIWFVTVN